MCKRKLEIPSAKLICNYAPCYIACHIIHATQRVIFLMLQIACHIISPCYIACHIISPCYIACHIPHATQPATFPMLHSLPHSPCYIAWKHALHTKAPCSYTCSPIKQLITCTSCSHTQLSALVEATPTHGYWQWASCLCTCSKHCSTTRIIRLYANELRTKKNLFAFVLIIG